MYGMQIQVRWFSVLHIVALKTWYRIMLAEKEEELQKVVDEFHNVCKWRSLKVNIGKIKIMVFEEERAS